MLFGHQNDEIPAEAAQAQITPVSQDATANPLALDPATGASLPVAQSPTLAPPPLPPAEEAEPSVLAQPAPEPVASTAPTIDPLLSTAPGAPAQPAVDTPSATPASDALAEALEQPTVETPAEPTPSYDSVETITAEPVETPQPTPEPTAALPVPSNQDLLGLKQQALQQLTPLVDQLDQTAEERFRTTMMMIQSTDNPTLIQDAYETAQTITDEKIRAQALLDVINEINYFTQQNASS